MRAPVMQAVRTDGHEAELVEVRRARPATGEVLVRVTTVALDRRDAEPFAGPLHLRPDASGWRTVGRHIVGEVATPGAGVDGWPLGRPVVVSPEAVLRRGWFVPGVTHDGGLAEYVAVPATALVQLPRGISTEMATRLPLAARAHAMVERVALRPGESLGVWGAGALGSAVVAVARALGAAPIVAVDPDATARAAALELGADVALDPSGEDFAEDLATASPALDVVVHAAPDRGAAPAAVDAASSEGRVVLAGPADTVVPGKRWGTRLLTGPARVSPGSVQVVAHLLAHGRLHLPPPPERPGGLAAAATALDAALRGGHPLAPALVRP